MNYFNHKVFLFHLIIPAYLFFKWNGGDHSDIQVTLVGLSTTKLWLLQVELSGAKSSWKSWCQTAPLVRNTHCSPVANSLRAGPCIMLFQVIKVETFQYCPSHSPLGELGLFFFKLLLFKISCWHYRA